jgi:hypothetical protein
MTTELTEEEIRQIIFTAQELAAVAAREYLDSIGGDNYPCGFAWVKIKPARGPFVKVLKELNLGHVDKDYGGYMIWNPSQNFCQNVDAKAAGAEVFTAELRKYGVNANAYTRWD